MRQTRDSARACQRSRRKLEFEAQKHQLPLLNKAVYMDMKHCRQADLMEEQLKKLGARVEKFLSCEVNYVISSSGPSKADERPNSRIENPHSPSNISSPFNCGPSPTGQQESRTSVVSRGKALAQIACAKNKASTVVANAEKLGIKVISIEAASKWLDKEVKKLKCFKDKDIKENKAKQAEQKQKENKTKSKALRGSFIKFDDMSRQYRPVKLEFEKWPKLNLLVPPGICPFGEAKVKLQHHVARNLQPQINVDCGPVFVKQEQAASKPEDEGVRPAHKPVATEFVGVPITTTGDARHILNCHLRKSLAINKQQGYCDCCGMKFQNMNEHINGEEHRAFARQKSNYESLDALINQVPSTVSFLQSVLLKHCVRMQGDTSVSSCPADSLIMIEPLSPMKLEKTDLPSPVACLNVPDSSGLDMSIVKDSITVTDTDLISRQEKTPTKKERMSDTRPQAVVIRRPMPSGMFTSPRRRQLTPSKKPWMQECSMVFRDSPIASLQPSFGSGQSITRFLSDSTLDTKYKKVKMSGNCLTRQDATKPRFISDEIFGKILSKSVNNLNNNCTQSEIVGLQGNDKNQHTETLQISVARQCAARRSFNALQTFDGFNREQIHCENRDNVSRQEQNMAVEQVVQQVDAKLMRSGTNEIMMPQFISHTESKCSTERDSHLHAGDLSHQLASIVSLRDVEENILLNMEKSEHEKSNYIDPCSVLSCIVTQCQDRGGSNSLQRVIDMTEISDCRKTPEVLSQNVTKVFVPCAVVDGIDESYNKLKEDTACKGTQFEVSGGVNINSVPCTYITEKPQHSGSKKSPLMEEATWLCWKSLMKEICHPSETVIEAVENLDREIESPNNGTVFEGVESKSYLNNGAVHPDNIKSKLDLNNDAVREDNIEYKSDLNNDTVREDNIEYKSDLNNDIVCEDNIECKSDLNNDTVREDNMESKFVPKNGQEHVDDIESKSNPKYVTVEEDNIESKSDPNNDTVHKDNIEFKSGPNNDSVHEEDNIEFKSDPNNDTVHEDNIEFKSDPNNDTVHEDNIEFKSDPNNDTVHEDNIESKSGPNNDSVHEEDNIESKSYPNNGTVHEDNIESKPGPNNDSVHEDNIESKSGPNNDSVHEEDNIESKPGPNNDSVHEDNIESKSGPNNDSVHEDNIESKSGPNNNSVHEEDNIESKSDLNNDSVHEEDSIESKSDPNNDSVHEEDNIESKSDPNNDSVHEEDNIESKSDPNNDSVHEEDNIESKSDPNNDSVHEEDNIESKSDPNNDSVHEEDNIESKSDPNNDSVHEEDNIESKSDPNNDSVHEEDNIESKSDPNNDSVHEEDNIESKSDPNNDSVHEEDNIESKSDPNNDSVHEEDNIESKSDPNNDSVHEEDNIESKSDPNNDSVHEEDNIESKSDPNNDSVHEEDNIESKSDPNNDSVHEEDNIESKSDPNNDTVHEEDNIESKSDPNNDTVHEEDNIDSKSDPNDDTVHEEDNIDSKSDPNDDTVHEEDNIDSKSDPNDDTVHEEDNIDSKSDPNNDTVWEGNVESEYDLNNCNVNERHMEFESDLNYGNVRERYAEPKSYLNNDNVRENTMEPKPLNYEKTKEKGSNPEYMVITVANKSVHETKIPCVSDLSETLMGFDGQAIGYRSSADYCGTVSIIKDSILHENSEGNVHETDLDDDITKSTRTEATFEVTGAHTTDDMLRHIQRISDGILNISSKKIGNDGHNSVLNREHCSKIELSPFSNLGISLQNSVQRNIAEESSFNGDNFITEEAAKGLFSTIIKQQTLEKYPVSNNCIVFPKEDNAHPIDIFILENTNSLMNSENISSVNNRSEMCKLLTLDEFSSSTIENNEHAVLNQQDSAMLELVVVPNIADRVKRRNRVTFLSQQSTFDKEGTIEHKRKRKRKRTVRIKNMDKLTLAGIERLQCHRRLGNNSRQILSRNVAPKRRLQKVTNQANMCIIPNIAEGVKKRRSCTYFNHEGQYADSGESSDVESTNEKINTQRVQQMSTHINRSVQNKNRENFRHNKNSIIKDLSVVLNRQNSEEIKTFHGNDMNLRKIEFNKKLLDKSECVGKTEDETDHSSAVVIRRKKSGAYPTFPTQKRPEVDWGNLQTDKDWSSDQNKSDDSVDQKPVLVCRKTGQMDHLHNKSLPHRGHRSITNCMAQQGVIIREAKVSLVDINNIVANPHQTHEENLVICRARHKKRKLAMTGGQISSSYDSQHAKTLSSTLDVTCSPRLRLKIRREPDNKGFSSTLEEIHCQAPTGVEHTEEEKYAGNYTNNCVFSSKCNPRQNVGVNSPDKLHNLSPSRCVNRMQSSLYVVSSCKQKRGQDDKMYVSNSLELPVKFQTSVNRAKLPHENSLRAMTKNDNLAAEQDLEMSLLHKSHSAVFSNNIPAQISESNHISSMDYRPHSPCFSSPVSNRNIRAVVTPTKYNSPSNSFSECQSPVFKTSWKKIKYAQESHGINSALQYSRSFLSRENSDLSSLARNSVLLEENLVVDSSSKYNTEKSSNALGKNNRLKRVSIQSSLDFPSAKRVKIDCHRHVVSAHQSEQDSTPFDNFTQFTHNTLSSRRNSCNVLQTDLKNSELVINAEKAKVVETKSALGMRNTWDAVNLLSNDSTECEDSFIQVPSFSSPDKATDSSWGDICDTYLSTSISKHNNYQPSTLAMFGKSPDSKEIMGCSLSPFRTPHLANLNSPTRKRAPTKELSVEQNTPNNEDGCKQTRSKALTKSVTSALGEETIGRGKVNDYTEYAYEMIQDELLTPTKNSNMQSSELNLGIQQVDEDISFNYMSPQRLSFSPQQGRYKESNFLGRPTLSSPEEYGGVRNLTYMRCLFSPAKKCSPDKSCQQET